MKTANSICSQSAMTTRTSTLSTAPSVEFIKRFESDYMAKPFYLTDNYRSTKYIIQAANAMIAPARQRMKSQHPIRIDRKRAKDDPGGALRAQDPVAQGKVQILHLSGGPDFQVRIAMDELKRLSHLIPNWDWTRCAVIAREWKYLDPIRAYCEDHGIPITMAKEEAPPFWRLRETQGLLQWMDQRDSATVSIEDLTEWVDNHTSGPWSDLLRQGLAEFKEEHCTFSDVDDSAGPPVDQFPVDHFKGMARGVGKGSASSAARPSFADGSSCQRIGIRPCGRAGRRMETKRFRRRSGCRAEAVLCGHDARPPVPGPCLFGPGLHPKWPSGNEENQPSGSIQKCDSPPSDASCSAEP